MKDKCLALCRDGMPCWQKTYRHSSLYFWRTPPATNVFCRAHDDEYKILLGKYTQIRTRCRSYRWVFTTRPYEIDQKSYESLKEFETICRSALFVIGEALELRALRCKRFAAAYDEFANDESVENLRTFMQHCVSLLQYCLTLMQFAPKRVSVLQTIVESVGSALRGPQPLHKHIQLSSELEMNSIPKTTVSKTLDLATTYFGPFGAALEVVALVQNLLPEAVATRIRDPMKAEHVAKRATLRMRLAAFLTSESDIVDQLGYDTVLGIRETLYRRLIIEDKLLLRQLKKKTYTIEALLDNKGLVSHTDLERLWNATTMINPATLRDALIDLAYRAARTLSRDSTNQDRSSESLPIKSWRVLHLIMGSRMTFADVYFLCATAQEFMSTMLLATFHESQFTSLLPRGSTGTEPLILCMRALGLFVTYWSVVDGQELIVGLMENNSSTRTFARTISSKTDISIRIRYFNGTVYRNDDRLETLGAGDCDEDPRAIKVNLEGVDGRPLKHLYRRTGQPFRDGFEIRLAPKSKDGDKSDAWKLDLLHDLALIQTGRRDVCAALDYSFDKIRRQSSTTADLSFLSKRRKPPCITQQSLAELKSNFSQRTLAAQNNHSRSMSTNDPISAPTKTRLSRHEPFSGSLEFQQCRPRHQVDSTVTHTHTLSMQETRRQQQRMAKSKFREHLSMSTDVPPSLNIATDYKATAKVHGSRIT